MILYSTGHGKNLASLEELIKNRLDEAYLHGLGLLDPNASYIHRLEEDIPGRQLIIHCVVLCSRDYKPLILAYVKPH